MKAYLKYFMQGVMSGCTKYYAHDLGGGSRCTRPSFGAT